MTKIPFVSKEKVEEIAAKYPTPFHLYDEKGIRKNVENLKKAFHQKNTISINQIFMTIKIEKSI